MSWSPLASFALRQIGTPLPRSLTFGTPVQASNSAKPALVSITLTSDASISLAAGASPEADLLIGATSVAVSAALAGTSSTGVSSVGTFKNSLTGLLVAGLNLKSSQTQQLVAFLPAGWFFAVRQKTATVIIVSAFDQAFG